jgi:hypothetical protein
MIQEAKAASLAVIIIVVYHLIINTFSPFITKFSFTIIGLTITSDKVKSTISNFLIYTKLNNLAWFISILIIIICIYLGFIGKHFIINSPTPEIINFIVHFQDGSEKIVGDGNSIDVKTDEVIQIKVDVGLNDQIECDWMAIIGTLGSAEGCATKYRAPSKIGQDSITVSSYSSCIKESRNVNGLLVNVFQNTP